MILRRSFMRRGSLAVVAAGVLASTAACTKSAVFDLVIRNGRVIDPDSSLDAVRSIGIRGGKIAAVSVSALQGTQVIDAEGLVVAPGFIDLHVHGQDEENYRIYATDGVTTALELELGTDDVPAFYAARERKALINYGVSAGHMKARMAVMKDGGTFLPLDNAAHVVATEAQIVEIRQHIERGLAAGALGVGMGLQYTPAASKYEVLEAFRSAATYHAPVFVHTRVRSRDRSRQCHRVVYGSDCGERDHRCAAPFRPPEQHEPRVYAEDARPGEGGT
jgi:N-acyl-D-aspartate/D-glutamate deacylase